MSNGQIRRFTSWQITVHWVFALGFMLAALTGAFQYMPRAFDGRFAAFAIGEAGQASRLIHRIGASAMLLAVLMYVIGAFRAAGRDMKEIFIWSGSDIAWLKKATLSFYWTGKRDGLPDEGRYNAGQKLAYLAQVIGLVVTSVTGLIMWFGHDSVSASAMQLAIMFHALAAVIAVLFFLIHLYMTTLHPLSKESITAMFTGMVSESYAQHHHPKWYQEQKEQAG